jgi:hypothetical protein
MFSGPRLEETLTNLALQTLPTEQIAPIAPIRFTSSELRKEGDSLMTQSESGDTRSQVLPGPEPEMTVLAKSSSSSPKTRKVELLTVADPQPNPKHTNRSTVKLPIIAVHHSTSPPAQIVQSLSTKQSLQDGSAEEHYYSQDKVMLEIHVNFRDSVIYI